MTDNKGWKKSLEKFQKGLKDAFEDITALEVNTMVVSQITGFKFQSEETYETIFKIPHFSKYKSNLTDYYAQLFPLKPIENPDVQTLENSQSPALFTPEEIETIEQFRAECYRFYFKIPSLHITEDDPLEIKVQKENLIQRHLEIRQQLTQSYHYYLRQETKEIAETANLPPLPDPHRQETKEIIEKLLKNRRFLSQLRKLEELKSLMECPRASANNVCDIIFAQTVIQIDGDILNRFDQRLFTTLEQDKQQFLLNTHQEAVTAGEKNWRELLNSVITLIKNIAEVID